MINESMFKDVECVSCFDSCVLEYFIDGAFVHVEKYINKSSPTIINVKYINFKNKQQKKNGIIKTFIHCHYTKSLYNNEQKRRLQNYVDFKI